ncbi:glycoside hydrolase family 31 protein [Streptomyces sp. NBC_00344]|uniref:glycoside hydrolase family 31 protein n=1 Tax=Streptomyces sp. NBC_00344 TaxID=2975720 RepID=UPI002E217DFB
MDARDLVRSAKAVGTAQGRHALRSAWRRARTDAGALAERGAERARVPGVVTGVEHRPGGGVIRFARSELLVRVAVGGAVFWGWDGAGPTPSYALADGCPEPDPRAVLEPDKDGGWRVVSERVTVAVSRHGEVEIRTPGGVRIRKDLPPRWWEPVTGGTARWVLRSQVPADARFFGLGGPASGPRLRDGSYRLWNAAPMDASGEGASRITMPVQLVVADAGTHLTFHDNTWDGRLIIAEGSEGAGSGHDRPGTGELRMEGGPLRCWVVAGTPARVLRGWTALTGRPALPPYWALGRQHVWAGHGSGSGGEQVAAGQGIRELVAGLRDRRLPLSAVHLAAGPHTRRRAGPLDGERLPDLPALARDLRAEGIRLVSVVAPAVPAEPGHPVYDSGLAAGVFVRDADGEPVRGVARPGACVYPDFTAPRARAWWGGLNEERLGQGFSGVWHTMDEPASLVPFGDPTLPLSSGHALEGRGGDHREAHNIYGLTMAQAAYRGLLELRPEERPFVVSRSGWAGMQRYGGAWSAGLRGWPGLRASLSMVLSLGLCGVPCSGTDAGGPDDSGSAELSLRRLQLACFLPLLRTGASLCDGAGVSWGCGPGTLEHARTALAGRERLLPYFMTLAHLSRLTGAPYVRPLWWGASGDRALRDCEDAFLLGGALLVAPVLEEGAVRRAVRLPRGRWYDTATGTAYEGPGLAMIDAPLSRVPVLARAGSVIPVCGEDGGLELEVWAPASGHDGAGVVVRDTGDGWQMPEIEHYTTTLDSGRVVVERVVEHGAVEAGYPVRVRGLSDSGR